MCFKTIIIMPVPKHSSAVRLNDFHPAALTSTIMKCFKRLVLAHLKTCLTATSYPLQFAYYQYRCEKYTISNSNTYVKMLSIDFRPAFNTNIPSKLITKLGGLGINNSLCILALDSPTNRPPHPEHWCPTGLCAEFSTLLSTMAEWWLVGLFDNDELAYRQDVQHLVAW